MKPLFPNTIFVTGTGTAVGKTVASAILVKALGATYWKPIQTGSTEGTDTAFVKEQTNAPTLNEAYLFSHPSSPHYAAFLEGKEIDMATVTMPPVSGRLVIEGAGGLLVPLNKKHCLIDLIGQLQTPVVLVAPNYLGAINHTLLSIEALKTRNISIAGVIYNGDSFLDNEEAITTHTGIAALGTIAKALQVNPEFITAQAKALRETLSHHFTL